MEYRRTTGTRSTVQAICTSARHMANGIREEAFMYRLAANLNGF